MVRNKELSLFGNIEQRKKAAKTALRNTETPRHPAGLSFYQDFLKGANLS